MGGQLELLSQELLKIAMMECAQTGKLLQLIRFEAVDVQNGFQKEKKVEHDIVV